MKRTALLGATLVGLLALSVVSAAAEAPLDRVDFGDVDSERAHEFRSEKATIPEATKPPGGLHVASVSASGGTAPQATLVETGEWGTDRIGDWIQYELSERTELGRVSIEWGRNMTFKFDIKVSPDGDTWQKVVDDRSWRKGRGSFETYEFDPVEARYVRIVAHGWTRRWRASNFFINQVRIGQLPHPEAYKPALAYRPGLGQSCRRLMPAGDSWEGGWMDFVVDCEPEGQNYLTVKLWGSDARMTYLHLKDGQGRWVYHAPHGRLRGGHNTSWTPLWEFTDNTAGGGFHGRFIYVTYPIPRKLTRGREEVRLRIQAAGSRIGEPMKVASQGIYDAYTHTDPFSGFAAEEPQGEPFEWGPPRPAPDDMTVLEKLKKEAREEIEPLMKGKGLSTEDYRGLLALTQAYHAEWSEYYHDKKIVRLVRDAIDDYIVRQAGEGKGPGGLGAGWHRHGNLAQSFVQVADAFEEMGYLKGKFHYSEGPPSSGQTAGRPYVRRRDAYAAFFKKALEWRRGPQPGARRRMANQ
ncbi:MAG: discoidin domain-containing protein, partial [Planctomycetota bacterium]